MNKDLELAIEAAKTAGDLIRSHYLEVKQLIKKGSNDFATETDVTAENLIIDILSRTGYAIFGEETGQSAAVSNRKWVIDPLDGTINFTRGLPFFGVSIALIEEDKKLLLGVIYDPIHDECYWAQKGKGAFMNGDKIHVTKESDGWPLVLIDHGKSDQSQREYLHAMERLMRQTSLPLMRYGTTALMLCYVARGSADAFLSCGDELYDYAAGLIIAQEAGAIVSDWRGNAWRNSNSYVLASKPTRHTEIVQNIKAIQDSDN